jgi:hypothetical protein
VGVEEHGALGRFQVAPAPDFLVLALEARYLARFAQDLADLVAGHAGLDLAEVLFGQHLLNAAVAPIRADGDEIGFLAHRAARVFQGAAAVALLPDHLGLAHPAAHVGFGTLAGGQILLGDEVAGRPQGGDGQQQSPGTVTPGTGGKGL